MPAPMNEVRPLGSEKSAERRATREQLLDAAAAVMTECESIDVSLQAIATKAGLTAPLVGYYFGGKLGLLRALARRDTERALSQVRALLAMDLPPEETLRLHVSGILRGYARRPYLNALFNRLLREETPESAREFKAAFVEPLAAAQREIIERGVAAGRFRPVDPALAYFLIVGACQYFFNNKFMVADFLSGESEEAAVDRYSRFVFDMLLNGLAAHPGVDR